MSNVTSGAFIQHVRPSTDARNVNFSSIEVLTLVPAYIQLFIASMEIFVLDGWGSFEVLQSGTPQESIARGRVTPSNPWQLGAFTLDPGTNLGIRALETPDGGNWAPEVRINWVQTTRSIRSLEQG